MKQCGVHALVNCSAAASAHRDSECTECVLAVSSGSNTTASLHLLVLTANVQFMLTVVYQEDLPVVMKEVRLVGRKKHPVSNYLHMRKGTGGV